MKKWFNALLAVIMAFLLTSVFPVHAVPAKNITSEVLDELTQPTRAPQSNAKVYVRSIRVCGERFWGQIENISGTVLENTVFIVASYDAENGLINTVVEPVATIAIDGAYKIDVPFNFEDAYVLKLFVWDSFETMRPYCAAYLPLGVPSVEGELQNFAVTAKFPQNGTYCEPILSSNVEDTEVVFKVKNISGTQRKIGFMLFLYNSNDIWIANTAVSYLLEVGQEDEFVVPLTDTVHKAALMAQLSGYAAEDLYLRVLVDDDPTDSNGFCKNMATVTAVNADYFGNTPSSAFPLGIGDMAAGSIDYTNDLDYFEFTTEAGKVTMMNLTGDVTAGIYGANSALVNPQGNGTYDLQAGTYYVKVSGAVGAYTLSVVQPTKSNAQQTITCVTGEEYGVIISGGDIASFSETFIVTYDPAMLTAVDLCGLTFEKETTTGDMMGGTITVSDYDNVTGSITLTFNKAALNGKNFDGTMNIVRFKAIQNGDTLVKVQAN